MKKVIRKKPSTEESKNIHLYTENEHILAKITYTPIPESLNDFLYTLVIKFKQLGNEVRHNIGVFNMIKAKNSLGEIIIDYDKVKIIPKKISSYVYNPHEKDIKEYVFSIK